MTVIEPTLRRWRLSRIQKGIHRGHLRPVHYHRRWWIAAGMSLSAQVEEVRIPLATGTIAGKWWGPQNVRPVVCLHGWLDNGGTFDRLIPLLPRQMSFLALDLPGHGHSAHIAHGTSYQPEMILFVLHGIMRHYGWPKISLMGHSMGAFLQYVFAAIFAPHVDLVVSLDVLKPPVIPDDVTVFLLSELIPHAFREDLRNQRVRESPAYTYAEAITRLHESTNGTVAREVCPSLLHRNIRPSSETPGKYYFARDGRLKYGVGFLWSQDVYRELATRLTMPFLFVKASQSAYWEERQHHDEIVRIFEHQNPDFEHRLVDGCHHVHLCHPERVAPIVSGFLERHWQQESAFASKL